MTLFCIFCILRILVFPTLVHAFFFFDTNFLCEEDITVENIVIQNIVDRNNRPKKVWSVFGI